MAYLIKKYAADFVYKFESPIAVHYDMYCDETGDEGSGEHDCNYADSDLNEFFKYNDIESIYEIAKRDMDFIDSISMKAENGKLITTVKAKRELADDEVKKIMSWVTGQNSDGFGEGLEQQAFDQASEHIEYEYEEYDEETGESEIIKDVGYEKTDYFIKLHPEKGYYIKQIK